MPVLMLARGDSQSKDMLRHAIEQRYGFRPPSLETLRLALRGQTRVAGAFLPVRLLLDIRFPVRARLRWRLFGLVGGSQANTPAETGRTSGTNNLTEFERRMWAFTALMLTPLTEQDVQLRLVDMHTLEAEETRHGCVAQLQFTADGALSRVSALGLDVPMHLVPEGANVNLDELIVPTSISLLYGETVETRVRPHAAQVNIALDDLV